MDNGKENEVTVVYKGYILGLYRDIGKENGSYYSILGLYVGFKLGQCKNGN